MASTVRFATCLIGAVTWFAPLLPAAADDGGTRIFSRYQGEWKATTRRTDAAPGSPDAAVTIANACAAAGTFYVCQQRVNDRVAALVVYSPGKADGEFQSTVIAPDGKFQASGLVRVNGEVWEYPWEETAPAGKRQLYRVVNTWAGPDHILFRKESSADGKQWTVLETGEEWKAGSQPVPAAPASHSSP